MKSYLLIASLIALLSETSYAQCDCDYTINKGGIYYNTTLNVPPGKIICIQAGHYDYLRFIGFVGAPNQPIRFINCGGQVTIGTDAYYSGLQFFGSRYFIVSGSGDRNYTYGIKLDQSNINASGVSITGLSSDCEVERVEVATAGFAGFLIKTDPSCDPATWRESFTMYNVKLHDNYVHDTGSEGFYIGNSFYDAFKLTCNGTVRFVKPHLIYGLSVYNNIIERTGAEGLQYGCAPDADVHHNQLYYTGFSPFADFQNNGLQISSGSGGDCYSNIIRHTAGTGLAILGHLGNGRIYNNVIYDSGMDGIFCDDRPGSLADTYMAFLNNTIARTGRDGIRLYNQNNVNTVANNAITQMNTIPSLKGRAFVFEQGATASLLTNFTAFRSESAQFVNDSTDFRPAAGSPLIGIGTTMTSWHLTTDLTGVARDKNSGFDIGAYAYVADTTPPGAAPPAQARVGYLTDAETRAPAIADVGQMPPLLIYPSPAHDQITVSLARNLSIRSVRVYNSSGQKVICQSVTTNQATPLTLPVGQLPPGNYIVDVLSRSAQRLKGRFTKL